VLLQPDSMAYGAPWTLVTWDVEAGKLALASRGSKWFHLDAVAADLVAPGS